MRKERERATTVKSHYRKLTLSAQAKQSEYMAKPRFFLFVKKYLLFIDKSCLLMTGVLHTQIITQKKHTHTHTRVGSEKGPIANQFYGTN